MGDKRHTATVYRADLLWGFSAIAEVQHRRLAALLGFEENQPPEPKPVQELPGELPETGAQTVLPQPQPDIPQTKVQTFSYYRIIDRQVDAGKMAIAEDRPVPPDWFTEAKPTYFAETQTRIPAMHRIQPEFPLLVSWPRLWPLLQRVLGADVPGTKPDLSKLVKHVSQGEQIQRIPKKNRYTWSPTARLLIDINDSNFPYRQDFIRLQQQLIAWRGEEGLEIQYIYDEPGGTIARYESGHEILEPWRSPVQGTPLLILSDLGMHTKSRRSLFQWLVFGQMLNLNGIRPSVLMPVAERHIDKRLLRYFDCIIWDGNSRLKPIHDDQSGENPGATAANAEQLLALLFPALRVELGLLRSIRQLLPASQYDVGHEVDVWNHAAVSRAGDEWGWQAGSREQYKQAFIEQFKQLSIHDQQHLIDQLGRYHARLPDELYFEAMHKLISLELPVPEAVKTATLDFMSMLVKTYQAYPEHQSLDLWVKRYLDRHDHPDMRNEHQIAFMAIERIRRHQQDRVPIQWPADIEPWKLLPFIVEPFTQGFFVFLRQKGMELELLSQPQPILLKDDWGCQSVIVKDMLQLTNNITLCYPGINGKQQQFILNLETDTPYRFSLPPGIHQLEIAEERITVEVQSANDKPDWVYARGVSSDGLFIETCSRDSKIYRLYWHPPEIGVHFTNESLNSPNPFKPNQTYTCPGFWYYRPANDHTGLKPDWADTAIRDQYGFYADVKIAGVMQRFRWIQPGSFVMGSPEEENGRYENETPHQVNLSQGYWLADTACTQALWQAVMHNNPIQYGKGENWPVAEVSWNDVQRFLKTCNRQQSSLNLRLPSEAEWEYACRAGTTGAFNFEGELSLAKVNYRGTWDDHRSWDKGALEKTAEVKSYPANSSGLYEMHGNIWEYCQDWYGLYSTQSITDPSGLETGKFRVMRGGSAFGHGALCRSANRGNFLPDEDNGAVGFRLARSHLSGQPGQTGSVTDKQLDKTLLRGALWHHGLGYAGTKQHGTKDDPKKTKGMIDSIKDLFKK